MSSPYTLFTFNSKLKRHGLQLEQDKASGTLTVKASVSNTRKSLVTGAVSVGIGVIGFIVLAGILFNSEADVIPGIIFLPFVALAGFGLYKIIDAVQHASSNNHPQVLRPDAFVHHDGKTETLVPKERMDRVSITVDKNDEGNVKKITLVMKYDNQKKSLPIFSVSRSDQEDLLYYIGFLNEFFGLDVK